MLDVMLVLLMACLAAGMPVFVDRSLLSFVTSLHRQHAKGCIFCACNLVVPIAVKLTTRSW